MDDKVQKTVVPLLLNHINRIKKKNELRAEIKRLNASDKMEEEDDNEAEGGEMMEEENELINENKKKAKAEESNKDK